MLGRFLAVKEWSKVIRRVGRERRSPGERDGISTSNKTRQVAETLEGRNDECCSDVVKKTLRISKALADKTAER